MYAIVIDGELKGSSLPACEIAKAIKQNDKGERLPIQVASFLPGSGWVPVCVEQFVH